MVVAKNSFGAKVQKQGYIYFYSGAKSGLERYLSTFFPARVIYHGISFPSIEHAFQAAKYLYSDKPDVFERIASEKTSLDAKRAGGKGGFRKFGATLNVSAWNAHSTGVMRDLIQSRTKTDALYRCIIKKARKANIKLLHYEKAFGKRGAEPFWGGYFKKDTGEFFGKNTLGRLMMSVPL